MEFIKLTEVDSSPLLTQNQGIGLGWQRAFSNGVRSVEELLEYVEVSFSEVNLPNTKQMGYFPLRVPFRYAEKIHKGNSQDPLLLQVLPSAQEFEPQPGFSQDPLDEARFSPVPGVIHKYPNRVLLVTTQACAIHCRYCFRRHFPYEENAISSSRLESAIEYIRGQTQIDEVILSGGDPLSVGDSKLLSLLTKLAGINHIKRLRIHSRLIATLPERVTPELVHGLMGLAKPMVMVVHVNHAQEIDELFDAAVFKIKQAGVHVLNQSVLLAGVNDCSATLRALHERLFQAGVLPYYLHLLDPVEGARHFDVTETKASEIVNQLLTQSPGYLVPKLVTEQPGLLSKKIIDLNNS